MVLARRLDWGSYLGNLHFCSPYATTRSGCLAQLEDYENTTDFMQITHGIILSEEEIKRRYVIRHLLIRPGLDPNRYRKVFGADVLEEFPVLRKWAEQEYTDLEENGYITLTEKGLGLSDYLGPQLISPAVNQAMHEWEVIHG